ncbi:MAG: hypothetical protein K5669_07760 [Lachnospiraceae bacterium]|nr:hypothetical protein [Lachnospiraceae bacterium]
MKRKVLSIILALGLAASSLAGCSKNVTPSGPVNQKDETEEPVAEVTEPEEVVNTEPEPEPEVTEPEPEESPEGFVLYNGGSENVYVTDIKGNKIAECNTEDLLNTDLTLGEYTSLIPLEYYDGDIFFKCSYVEDNNMWCYDIMAYNVESGNSTLVYGMGYEQTLAALDAYNDKIYIATYDYNSDDGRIRYREQAFSKNKETSVYTEEDTPINEIFEKADGYYFFTNSDNVYRYSPSMRCFTRDMDEYGHLVSLAENNICLIDSEGNAKLVDYTFEYYIQIFGYDKENVFFKSNVPYDEREAICRYSIVDNDAEIIPETEGANALCVSNGKLYYYKDLSEEYGIINNHFYAYDLESSQASMIYETRNAPGVSYNPGVQGFTIIDNQIYFIDLMDRVLKWVRVNYDESGASYTDIYCPDKEIVPLKYGNVIYESNTEKCEKCGTPLVKEYVETFVLDSKYSDYADEINRKLEVYDSDESVVTQEISDEECEEHQQNPDIYLQTNESRVSDVRFIGDKYLTVDMTGYWYGGGVHGMPSKESRIFDLTTGEEKKLSDFYSGSDADFAELVGDIVARDYDDEAEYTKGMFAVDAASAKETVVNSTELDTPVRFDEEGLYVVYAPYLLGPFASGFIEVYVTYEELLGRKAL